MCCSLNPVDSLELWMTLAVLVLQTPLPRALVIALGFLTSQYSQFPHKQLLRTQHCLSILKVIIRYSLGLFQGFRPFSAQANRTFVSLFHSQQL